MSSTRKDRPLTQEEIRAQMDFMNDPQERKLAQDVHTALNEGTRPVSASSSAAFEAKEREEKKANDKTIASLGTEGVAKGPSPELNAKQTPVYTYPKTTISRILHNNSIIKLDDSRLKQRPQPKLTNLSAQVTESMVSPYLSDCELARLSTSCATLYSQTHLTLKFRKFAKAMLDQDLSTLSNMLSTHPMLLFAKLQDFGITKIQSHYTWLQYLTKNQSFFSAAQLLQLVDVVRVMLPYYLNELQDAQKRKDEPNIIQLENAWIMRVPTIEEQKALRKKYTNEYILPVITALLADTTIQVVCIKNPDIGFYEARIDNASEATLIAFNALREALFEPKALEHCIDVNQLLIAAYNAYDDKLGSFQNQDFEQRKAYAILVIGLIQSLVDPRLGRAFCQSLSNVVEGVEQIEERAQSLKLEDGQSFYRSSPNLASGLGFTFLCSVAGFEGRVGLQRGASARVDGEVVEKYVAQETIKCAKLTQRVQQIQTTQPAEGYGRKLRPVATAKREQEVRIRRDK